MIHATVMALRVVRGDHRTMRPLHPEWRKACAPDSPSLSRTGANDPVAFSMGSATNLLAKSPIDVYPTCPRCLVLLDAALEQSTRAGA